MTAFISASLFPRLFVFVYGRHDTTRSYGKNFRCRAMWMHLEEERINVNRALNIKINFKFFLFIVNIRFSLCASIGVLEKISDEIEIKPAFCSLLCWSVLLPLKHVTNLTWDLQELLALSHLFHYSSSSVWCDQWVSSSQALQLCIQIDFIICSKPFAVLFCVYSC